MSDILNISKLDLIRLLWLNLLALVQVFLFQWSAIILLWWHSSFLIILLTALIFQTHPHHRVEFQSYRHIIHSTDIIRRDLRSFQCLCYCYGSLATFLPHMLRGHTHRHTHRVAVPSSMPHPGVSGGVWNPIWCGPSGGADWSVENLVYIVFLISGMQQRVGGMGQAAG